jgi:hypothetical protein
VSGDVHTPTSAGPAGATSSFGTSAGAAGVAAQPADKPELQVGAAFAGGLVTAMILKRIFNRG